MHYIIVEASNTEHSGISRRKSWLRDVISDIDCWLHSNLMVGAKGTMVSCSISNNAYSTLDKVVAKSAMAGKTTEGNF